MVNKTAGTAMLALCMAEPELARAENPLDNVKLSALVEAGITATNNDPASNVNFGHLLTDKHDQMVLNQAMLTAQKDLDPKVAGYDWGFKLQGFYGADARYTHAIGLLDHTTDDRNQFDITEANLLAHLPAVTTDGVDVKAGLYSTPLGSEVIQASGNYLYSHSYIFNFGLPYKHTGILTTTHAGPMLDVYLGLDTGTNTTFGARGDNNGALAGIAGLGLNNLMDGKLTVLALSHFGPENPSRNANGTSHADDVGRYYNDVVVTYKPDDTWTFVTEGNFVRDDLTHANGGGAAQYAVYAWAPWLSLVGRAEIFGDPNNAFVAGFPGNNDFVNFERGLPLQKPLITAAHGTTYAGLTLGANIKPPQVPAMVEGAMIRPEVRYDSTLTGAKAFNDAKDNDQWSFGMDVVVPLSF